MGGSQAEREQRVTPLELLFDLVFVSAFAQVMTFLIALVHDPVALGCDSHRLLAWIRSAIWHGRVSREGVRVVAV
jgi:low temperature requirement protein LtrA